MRKIITSTFIFLTCIIHAQKNQKSSFVISKNEKIIVDYSTLTTDSLNKTLNIFMKEMYRDCQNFIPNYLELNKDFISRAKIIEIKGKEIDQYKNISNVSLKSKCNSEIASKNAQNFTLKSFNPIVYAIDFMKAEDQYFRIYNTQYVLYIKSK